MAQGITGLKERWAEISRLKGIGAVLEWDLQTYMPPGGARARSEQLGLISRLAHELLTSEETGRLIAEAEREAAGLSSDSDEARMVANARRDYRLATKIPVALAAEIARHTTLAQDVWVRARAANDFGAFAPSLTRIVELAREVAERLGYKDDIYDPLLDEYEVGTTAADAAAVFAELKPRLVDLTHRIAEARSGTEDPRVTGSFPVAQQSELTKKVAALLGYDFQRGRQDVAPHPFCTTFARGDVRITTRFNESLLDGALYSSIHETGHALYEQGIPDAFEGTPLDDGASMGVHESQSRLWENLVGRSRAFCGYLLPTLQEMFPDAYGSVTVDRFYHAANRVEPSLIRTEADEVTYNLHLLLRFELERDLLAGRRTVADLPQVWNAKMEQYLGITPPDDASGVLQDVHWAAGLVGYFPTYTLGNVISGQLWHTAQQALPELEEQIGRGEFAPLLGWLRENVHRYGRKYTPKELLVRSTGEPLTAKYYLDYLEAKFGELYGV